MKEKNIINPFLIAAAKRGARMFRVNTGLGWIGNATRFSKQQFIKVMSGDVLIRHARPLHAGLCKGGSDTIGWSPLKITAEMIGRTIAVFTAVEIKTENVRTKPEQTDFVEAIKKDGGRAIVAHSVEEGLSVLD